MLRVSKKEELIQLNRISTSDSRLSRSSPSFKVGDGLLSWCAENTADYSNVRVENYDYSWKDGLAFCAIIHKVIFSLFVFHVYKIINTLHSPFFFQFRPELIDYESLSDKDVEKNLELAFSVGEKLGIPRLLEPEDFILVKKPEPRSIKTYLQFVFNFFTFGKARVTGFLGGAPQIDLSESMSRGSQGTPTGLKPLHSSTPGPSNSTDVSPSTPRPSNSSSSPFSSPFREASPSLTGTVTRTNSISKKGGSMIVPSSSSSSSGAKSSSFATSSKGSNQGDKSSSSPLSKNSGGVPTSKERSMSKSNSMIITTSSTGERKVIGNTSSKGSGGVATTSKGSGGVPTDKSLSKSSGGIQGEKICVNCKKSCETGDRVTFKNNYFHKDCFGCHSCKRKLPGNKCISVEGLPYCSNCGRKAFIVTQLRKKEGPSSDSNAPESKDTTIQKSSIPASSNPPASSGGASSLQKSVSTSSIPVQKSFPTSKSPSGASNTNVASKEKPKLQPSASLKDLQKSPATQSLSMDVGNQLDDLLSQVATRTSKTSSDPKVKKTIASMTKDVSRDSAAEKDVWSVIDNYARESKEYQQQKQRNSASKERPKSIHRKTPSRRKMLENGKRENLKFPSLKSEEEYAVKIVPSQNSSYSSPGYAAKSPFKLPGFDPKSVPLKGVNLKKTSSSSSPLNKSLSTTQLNEQLTKSPLTELRVGGASPSKNPGSPSKSGGDMGEKDKQKAALVINALLSNVPSSQLHGKKGGSAIVSRTVSESNLKASASPTLSHKPRAELTLSTPLSNKAPPKLNFSHKSEQTLSVPLSARTAREDSYKSNPFVQGNKATSMDLAFSQKPGGKKTGKAALLLWAQKKCEPMGVQVDNFHTSFADGRAFCAIVFHYAPDTIDWKSLKTETRDERFRNHQLVFDAAEKFGVTKLLDPEDMVDIPKPEPLSVATYLSEMRKVLIAKFPDK